uniref:Uncharacterized protein n=1 Tax=Toxoplasma gondii (strain ATCC 50861 / VEG) TaxID=432359 RepID=A0A0F7V8C4_TOXGV|nr:TPA: hypothetical protein BN1205_068540 [Toxoplasma gondii VEG]
MCCALLSWFRTATLPVNEPYGGLDFVPAAGEDLVSADDVAVAGDSAGSKALTVEGSLGKEATKNEKSQLNAPGSNIVEVAGRPGSFDEEGVAATGQAAAKATSVGEKGVTKADDVANRAAVSGANDAAATAGKALGAAERKASPGKDGAKGAGRKPMNDAGGKEPCTMLEKLKAAWRAFVCFFKRLLKMNKSESPNVCQHRETLEDDRGVNPEKGKAGRPKQTE